MNNCELARLVYSTIKPKETKIHKSFHDEIYENVELDLEGALNVYTDGYYKTINRLLYEGEDLEKIDQEIAHLFKYEGDYSGKVYRHTYISNSAANKILSIENNNPTLPQFINSRILLSTSKNKSVHDVRFAYLTRGSIRNSTDNRDLYLTINIPEEQKQYDITKYSKYKEEDEVIIEPDSIMEIMDIKNYDDGLHLTLNLLSSEYIKQSDRFATEFNIEIPKRHIWKGLMSAGAIAPSLIDTNSGGR